MSSEPNQKLDDSQVSDQKPNDRNDDQTIRVDQSKDTETKTNDGNLSKNELKIESAPNPLTDCQPIASASTSAPNPNSMSNSEESVLTMESLKYLQLLDLYVTGKHWNFDIEYHLNAFSAILWSIVVNYFAFYEVSDNCWSELFGLLLMSSILSTITCIGLIVVWILWYFSLILQLTNRNLMSKIVIWSHLLVASFNLILAINQFGANTCHMRRGLNKQMEHIVPVMLDIKTTAIIHLIISINLSICALLLAIKRNDFKFYVLWRQGILNEYLMAVEED